MSDYRALRAALLSSYRHLEMYRTNAEFKVYVDSMVNVLPAVLDTVVEMCKTSEERRQQAEELMRWTPLPTFPLDQFSGAAGSLQQMDDPYKATPKD